MTKGYPRVLLAFSALILVVGGLMHAAAFDKALLAVASSDLPPFYARSLKALWLIDSATLVILAIVCGINAARPIVATRSVVLLVAFVPLATAVLLCTFVGNFLPAHMQLAAAAAGIFGGLQYPRANNPFGRGGNS